MSARPELATCTHCGQRLVAGRVHVDENGGRYCCVGCEAAARFIAAAGLSEYYPMRTAAAAPPQVDVDFSSWDSPAFQAERVRLADGVARIDLALDGVRCAACAWLIERAAPRWPGLVAVSVNAATARAELAWRPAETRLSALLAHLSALGYRAWLTDTDREDAERHERRRTIKRIAVAGFGTLQAMMFSEALLFGGSGMDAATRDVFRWLAFALATPVVFYAGWPFLANAGRELRAWRPGMDTLVALSTLLAWAASLVETLRRGPEVYFDAAVMFVFFLSVARYAESAARRRAGEHIRVLARAQPAIAHRLDSDGRVADLAAGLLAVGDRVRVREGEALPADGVLLDGSARFDEALLSGEARAVLRHAGDAVLAGSILRDAAVDLRVDRVGADTRLAQIVRLADHAAGQRATTVLWAERIAIRMVWGLLALSVVVGGYWFVHDRGQTLPVLLALLAATCPCALALAVPATLAAAHGRLARDGVLVATANALPALAEVRHWVFDKTGTLTCGQDTVDRVEVVGAHDKSVLLNWCAALERESNHPLAASFRRHDDGIAVSDRRVVAGGGVAGSIDGRSLRFGRGDWAVDGGQDDGALWLSDDGRALARIELHEQLREGTAAAIAALRRDHTISLWSGDSSDRVATVARALDISDVGARLTAEEKARRLGRSRQFTAVVGDGINDAPMLSAAGVGIALGHGAALAHIHADIVVLGEDLRVLPRLVAVAREARRRLRQNLAWAVAYNALALPLAACGGLPPWAAALGMTLSSLLVSANAWRRWPAEPAPASPEPFPNERVATTGVPA